MQTCLIVLFGLFLWIVAMDIIFGIKNHKRLRRIEEHLGLGKYEGKRKI